MIPNDFPTVQRLEAEGWFERARQGDGRAASLFARLVAYTLNPNGDPSGWGWLSKPSGRNYDGYAEDAIVFGADPNNLHNVIDLVAGAGAPRASIRWSPPQPRRPDNVWVAPRPLTADELGYLSSQMAPTSPTPVPFPTPPPPPPVDLGPVLSALVSLMNDMAHVKRDIDALHGAHASTAGRLEQIDLRVQDIRKALNNGLAVSVEGRVTPLGGHTRLAGVAKG